MKIKNAAFRNYHFQAFINMTTQLNRITVFDSLPPHTALFNDDFSVDLPHRFSDFCVCLHSAIDENLMILLLTERAHDEGLGISIVSDLKEKGYRTDVNLSSVDFIKLVRSRSITKSKITDTKATTQTRFSQIVQSAIDSRASDIHFQINEAEGNIYFRVDGDLVLKDSGTSEDFRLFLETHYTSFSDDHEEPGYTNKKPLSSTAKGVFTLNKPYIALKGERFVSRDVEVKVRKQSMPLNSEGADEVWRLIIIDKQSRFPRYDELGYTEDQAMTLMSVIRKPKGLILWCGTTGSGKSMSNAVSLASLVDFYQGRKSIRSVENPVEMPIPGVRQWSIPKASDYGVATRTFMRGDPDIISVGEIIDVESATAAAHSALSGHLTFSTLHAGTPLKAVKRLEHYGVDKLTLSEDGFLNAVIVQTLIKKLCPNCKVDYSESRESSSGDVILEKELKALDCAEFDLKGRGQGCEECQGKGATGRQVVAQVMEITPEMRALISQDKLIEAFSNQQNTILHHALDLMKDGIVSPLDVLSSCGTLDLGGYV